VNLTARDKKIAIFLMPIALIGVYWMVLLAPKREEAATLSDQLVQAEQSRDAAQAQAGVLQGARENYANDYAVVVRLGKAIPPSVDMPSLLVQLDQAAKGTGIGFSKVTAGERAPATAPAAAPGAPPTGAQADGAPPVAAGGEEAQSGPGKPVETANGATGTSADRNAAGGADAAPAAEGAAPPAATSPTAPGLDSVPLQFSFTGGFFELADFFHEMKRFVYVANGRVKVQGRLLTIDSFRFDSTTFPTIKTEVEATVFLSPKAEGATAGATPSGPTPAGTPAPTDAPTPEPVPAQPATNSPENIE
jgi:hypothetical protein